MSTSTVTPASLTFLPWTRQGVAAAIATVDSLGPKQPAVADLMATLAVNGQAAGQMPVRLRGPADVVGIDRNQIVRMDPLPGSGDFEPTYFPSIEFDRADFPWLFTPAAPAASAKLRPWLCLVVVRKQVGVTLAAGATSSLPTLQIAAPALPAVELPNLTDSWAWAHAQAAALDGGEPQLRAALQGAPGLSLSRLVCARILAADTDYIACVVPTFELGRRAGLGLPVSDADLVATTALAPAWTLNAATVQVLLPVYHHWEFRTGVGGDFATLAARLRPQPAPDGLGQRPIDIGRPGLALPSDFPAPALLMAESALRPVLPANEVDTMAPWPAGTMDAFQDELARVVNAPGLDAVLAPDADPLLAPPLYGRWHARRATVDRTKADWYDQLNLDPRLRSVAAFGTAVVQEHQEALMASAWEQAGELQPISQRLRQLQMSQAVGDSLHARHFVPLAPMTALRISAPVLARLAPVGPNATNARSMLGLVATTPIPTRALSMPMRRLGRERGPLTRRVAARGGARFESHGDWVATLAAGHAELPAPGTPDVVSFDAVVTHMPPQASALQSWASVSAAAVDARPGLPWFVVRAEGEPVPLAFSYTRNLAGDDGPTARDFRRAAAAHLARVPPDRSLPGIGFRVAADIGQLVQSLTVQTQPRQTVPVLAGGVAAASLASARGAPTIARAPVAAVDEVPLIDFVPSFPVPMYETLRDLAPDLLLRGVGGVPDDAVLGLETNRRFVEAFMVGLNAEMARELLWRGFPTQQDGTCFDHFWGGGADIPPLADWGERALGDSAGSQPRDQFVMLIRSALLRRYPNALIYLTPAIVTEGRRAPSEVDVQERLPVFAGSLPPDIAFFGFDLPAEEVVGAPTGTGDGWYLVIQQHPTEPRFGLQANMTPPATSHLALGSTAPGNPALPAGLEWGRNAAHMAAILRRMPVRLAIHGSQFIKARA